MSQIVEYVNYTEERGQHMERVVEIYESADAARGHTPKPETEDSDVKTQHTGALKFRQTPDLDPKCDQETEDTKRNQIHMQNRGDDKKVSRGYALTAVCVLLLAAVTVLWLKFTNLTTENRQLQTRYGNLTIQKNSYRRRKMYFRMRRLL